MTAMYSTTPIRLFLVFAVLALLGFGCAAWTAGAPLAVLVGTIASFFAALAVIVEVERGDQALPGTSRRSASTDHAAPRVL
jgi:hypothetical protein